MQSTKKKDDKENKYFHIGEGNKQKEHPDGFHIFEKLNYYQIHLLMPQLHKQTIMLICCIYYFIFNIYFISRIR